MIGLLVQHASDLLSSGFFVDVLSTLCKFVSFKAVFDRPGQYTKKFSGIKSSKECLILTYIAHLMCCG